MDHQVSSQNNSEDEGAESEPGGHWPNSDMEVEEDNSSSGDSSGPGATSKTESNDTSSSNDPPSPVDPSADENSSSSSKPSTKDGKTDLSPVRGVKPLTPILSTGNKERRQGRVNTVSISENISSPIKNLTLDINASETMRRRTLSEGEGLLGYSPNRKPSILTPDAPEFVPRWLQDSPSSDGPPASAPFIGDGGHNNHNNNNNNHHKNRSRSMGGGFNQLNHFPPHSAPMAGFGRPPPGPFSGGIRVHPFNFGPPPRHPNDRRISAPAMPYMNQRYPGAVPLYHAVEPLTPVMDAQGQFAPPTGRNRHSSGGDLPSLGRGPSPGPLPPGIKRNRNESIADYLPLEPPMFYSPGIPRQALMGYFNNNNNRQKLRRKSNSISGGPNHVVGSPPTEGIVTSGSGEKPLLQYSKEFLLQQRYSPLSWTTPAFVPQSEGGIARRTSSTTDPREPDAQKGGALPELACIKRKDELSYDYSVGPRRWESTSYGKKRNVDEQAKSKGSTRAFRFTFVSYNILSQSCLEDNKHLYDASPPEVLEWDHRKHNLLKEIMHFKADIISLQEVNQNVYDDFFKPNMEMQGYKGVYKRRTGEEKQDGCAIFYHAEKFELKKTLPIDFNRGVEILDRNNVALLIMLQPKKDWTGGQDMRLCVATTHLLFNPKRGDIKLAQLAVLLAELDRFTRKGIEPGTGMPLYHPSILCGDFNAVPYSEIYRLVHRGRLKYENLVSKDISGQQDEESLGLVRFVAKPLLPKAIGITEQCQYADIATRYVRTRSDTSMTLNSISDAEDLMAHAARAAAEATRKASMAAANASLTISSPSPPESADVFNYDSNDEKGDAEKNSDSAFDDKSADIVDEDADKVSNGALELPSSESVNIGIDANLPPPLSPSSAPTSPASPSVAFASDSASERTRHESSSSVGSSGVGGGPPMPVPTGELNHAFRLLSVYKHVEERRGRNLKEVTTHHGKGQSTVDYIFFSVKAMKTECKKGRIIPKNIHEGPLKLMGRYRLLNEEDSANMGTLPNTVYSSDHFALAAKFVLDPN